MDLFIRLKNEIELQNRQGDLLDFIVPPLLQVADHPEIFTGREELVADLLERAPEFDSYSEASCEKTGFGLPDIHQTLDRLKISY